MPTIDRVKGFRVMIYTDEPAHERPHVHILKDRNDAKVWLDNLTFAHTANFSAKDIREIEKIINDRWQTYLKKWQEIHGA